MKYAFVCSPVKKLNDLLIRVGKERRVRKCEAFVTVDNFTLIRLPTGKIYSPNLGPYAYAGPFQWTPKLLKALVALEVITQQEADQHQQHCDKLESNRELKNDRKTLEQLKEKYGEHLQKLKASK